MFTFEATAVSLPLYLQDYGCDIFSATFDNRSGIKIDNIITQSLKLCVGMLKLSCCGNFTGRKQVTPISCPCKMRKALGWGHTHIIKKHKTKLLWMFVEWLALPSQNRQGKHNLHALQKVVLDMMNKQNVKHEIQQLEKKKQINFFISFLPLDGSNNARIRSILY